MGKVHTAQSALTEAGAVKGFSLEAGPGDKEVSVVVEMASEALADALFEELSTQFKRGEFRLGPLSVTAPPSSIREVRDAEG